MKLQRAHRANFFARARGRRRIATLSLLRWWTRTSLAVLLMVTASLRWASTRAKCSMTAWKRWAASERRYRTLLSRGRRRSRAIAGDVARAQRMALDRWRSFVWWREQVELSMHYSARRRVADGFAALLDLPEQARARELLHSIAQQHHRTRILAGWQRSAQRRAMSYRMVAVAEVAALHSVWRRLEAVVSAAASRSDRKQYVEEVRAMLTSVQHRCVTRLTSEAPRLSGALLPRRRSAFCRRTCGTRALACSPLLRPRQSCQLRIAASGVVFLAPLPCSRALGVGQPKRASSRSHPASRPRSTTIVWWLSLSGAIARDAAAPCVRHSIGRAYRPVPSWHRVPSSSRA